MPKDEFDFDDPLELNGVALCTDEDTQRDMAECFAEEFLLLGYNHKQLLALFRNPHYLGMNMVLQNKGEAFVKEIIRDVFARWGKKIEWPVSGSAGIPAGEANRASHAGKDAGAPKDDLPTPSLHPCIFGSGGCSPVPDERGIALDEKLTDPLGNPVPRLNL